MWSLCRFDLHLSEDEFWRTTPRLIHALLERWRVGQEREDRRVARVMALTANVNRDPKKRRRPYVEDDFLPQRQKRRGGSDWQKQKSMAEMLNAAFGGRDLRTSV